MIYDIAIIGGGPAGANLARLLDSKYKILVIEKRDTSQCDERHNICCGGLLAPAAQKIFAKYGIGIPKDVLSEPQLFSVQSIDFDSNIIKNYQRHYINIEREKFDRWFLSLAIDRSNVDVLDNTLYKSYSFEKGIYTIQTNNKSHQIKTRILVGADGSISRVRNKCFNQSTISSVYNSIQKEYAVTTESPYFTSIFSSDITDFYSWIIQKEDRLLIGTAIPEIENPNIKFDILINQLKNAHIPIGAHIKTTGTKVLRTRHLSQINTYDNSIGLVGESAGFISPSSAEGISYALWSSELLANAINTYDIDFGRHYKKNCKKIALNILYKNFKSAIMYQPFLRKLVMKSGFLSIKSS